MRGTACIVCLFVMTQGTFGQKVTVQDQSTREALENVTIVAHGVSGTLYTDARGQADIALVRNADSLLFRHPGYRAFVISYGALESQGFVVLMTQRSRIYDEVVVSAGRWEQSLEDVPHQVLAVSPREIVFNNPATTADVLSGTGEVFVQKSQHGGGSPMLRGHAANAVLMVFDGVRMNNAIYRSGNLQNIISVDANFLERAEVLFGPGSVLYGSDALGGVMLFESRDPRPSLHSSLDIRGNAFSRYASASEEKTQHLDLSLGFNSIASFTSFSYNDFGDLRAGGRRKKYDPEFGKRTVFVERINGRDSVITNDDVNVQRGSAYTQWNLMQKLLFRPMAELDIVYGLNLTSSSDIPRYDRLIELDANGSPVFAEWYYGPQKWQMHSLTTSLRNSNPVFSNGRLILALQRVEESRHDRRRNNNQLRSQVEKVDIFSGNADFERVLEENTDFRYGLEVVHNKVTSEAQRRNTVTGAITPVATRYPDGGSTMWTYAGYVHLTRKLSEQTILSGGARYSHVALDAQLVDTTFFKFPFREIVLNTGALTGSMGLVHHPQAEWKIHAGASSGFRAPNVDDVGKVFESAPGIVVVPNDKLGPEYSYTLESGVAASLSSGFSFSVLGYYSWLVDAHVRRNFQYNGQDSILYDGILSQVVANVNAGKAYIAGVTASFGLDILPQLSLNSTITFTAGRDKANDIPLRHVPPLFGRGGVTFRGPDYRVEAYAVFNGWRHFEDLPPEEQAKTAIYSSLGTPGWTTINVKGSYQIIKHVQVTAGVENIFDVHYRTYSSGISAPGRNFVGALHVRI
jgi:hemoglobin/transferrin/lactoferrin receptor protein